MALIKRNLIMRSNIKKELIKKPSTADDGLTSTQTGSIGARRGSRILGPMPANLTAIDTFSPLPKVWVTSPSPKLLCTTLSPTLQLLPGAGPACRRRTAFAGAPLLLDHRHHAGSQME